MSTLMESWPQRHRISVHDYHRMAEVGVLAPDARVELIEGEIIDMAPIGKDHQSVVDQLNRMLVRAVGDRAKVPLYARHGVPEVWVVDVNAEVFLVYAALRNGKYERHDTLERPANVPLTHVPGVTLDVAPLFAR
jgi:Uma2 family endonuclease